MRVRLPWRPRLRSCPGRQQRGSFWRDDRVAPRVLGARLRGPAMQGDGLGKLWRLLPGRPRRCRPRAPARWRGHGGGKAHGEGRHDPPGRGRAVRPHARSGGGRRRRAPLGRGGLRLRRGRRRRPHPALHSTREPRGHGSVGVDKGTHPRVVPREARRARARAGGESPCRSMCTALQPPHSICTALHCHMAPVQTKHCRPRFAWFVRFFVVVSSAVVSRHSPVCVVVSPGP
jgi:hypothetical protein